MQLSIFSAIKGRDQAFARIEKAQNYADWKPIAKAFIAQFVAEHRGEEWTGEDLSDGFAARGLMPPGDLRWFGPVVQAALRSGVMRRVEGRTAPRRHGNGTFGASIYVGGR